MVEQRELTTYMKQLKFAKNAQTIQAYLYASEALNEIFMFVQHGPLKEQLITYAPKRFLEYGFHQDLFISATEPQEIIQCIETHLASLDIEAFDERPNCLHLYGQQDWHSDAFIVGNRAALEKLHKSIGEALQHGEKREVFFPSDGEGYELYISCVEDTFDFEQLDEPYHHPEIFTKRQPPLKAFKKYDIND